MRLAVLALCTALASGACGGCGDGDSATADTEWLSQGEGVASSRPLMPLRPGMRGSHLLVDGAVRHRGQKLLRLRTTTFPLGFTGGQHDALLLGEGEEGVELHGPEEAPFERPLLWVPQTVRVGMRWRSQVPGHAPVEFEVTRREERTAGTVDAVPYGPTAVWTITEHDAATGKDQGWNTFLEGFGLYQSGHDTFGPVTMPLEGSVADAPVVPDLPATPLTRLPTPDGWADNLHLVTAGLVVPVGASKGTLVVKGWRSCRFASADGLCLEEACLDFDAAGAAFGAPLQRVETYHVGPGCIRHRLTATGNPTADTGWLEVTSHASGALVLPAGVHWVPRNKDGTNGGYPLALYADPQTREPRLLFISQNGIQYISRATWADYLPQGRSFTGETVLTGQWTPSVISAPSVFGGSNHPSWTATLSAPGEPLDLAVITNQELLLSSRLEGDHLHQVVPASGVAGAPSVTATESGHRVVFASPGGRIDQLARKADGTLAREAIAHVTPPAGEQVVAALDTGGLVEGQLLVVTWKPPVEVPGTTLDSFGSLSFHLAPRQAPVRWDWPRAAGVTGMRRIHDAIVCWPPTTASLERTGWTIGGAPAKQVLELPDRCALVVRDIEADPALGGRSMKGLSSSEAAKIFQTMRFDVTGPVPGVGRMWVAPASDGEDPMNATQKVGAFVQAGALAGGGFANGRRLFGPGGVERAVPEGAQPGTTMIGAGVPDLSGAGVWMLMAQEFQLVGPKFVRVARQPMSTHVLFSPLRGGLVVWEGGSQWAHYRTDGTVAQLPAAPADFGYRVWRRDGQLCGSGPGAVACVDGTTGAETARIQLVQPAITALLPDDSMLVKVEVEPYVYDTLRWVPGSSPTPYGRYVTKPTTALDGTVYCIAYDQATSADTAGRCTPTGFVPLDLSLWEKTTWLGPAYFNQLESIIAGPDELFVVTYGCLGGSCRTFSTRLPVVP